MSSVDSMKQDNGKWETWYVGFRWLSWLRSTRHL